MSDQVEWPPRDWPAAWESRFGFSAASLPRSVAGLAPLTMPWPSFPSESRPMAAAVAVLFIPGASSDAPARIVFTRRSTTVRSHKGQIAFAGGRAEAGDLTPADTALRELEEELGVPRQTVRALATLRGCRALDGSGVTPVLVAAALALDELRLCPDEVAYAFAEPWTSFMNTRGEAFRFNIFGQWRESHRYRAGEESIWGLTAFILQAADFG